MAARGCFSQTLSHLPGFQEETGNTIALETSRQQRKEREAFIGHCYNKCLSPVPFCPAPERGTTHSLRTGGQKAMWPDKVSIHCSMCPGEIMALNLLK